MSGNIIKKLGVKYLYIISFGVMAPILFCVFLFVRETTFHRRPTPRTTAGLSFSISEVDITPDETKKSAIIDQGLAKLTRTSTNVSSNSSFDESNEQKHPLSWHLRIYRGRLTNRSFIWAFLQPFPLMIFPSVLFSTIVNGAMLTWALISGIITAQVLLYPPYNIQPDTLAYLSLPGSAVALIFSLVSGYLSDWMIKFMAKRNSGIYEPEFRLIMLVPAVLFSTLGFLLLGPMYARHAPVWQLVAANQLFSIAMPFGSSACTTYILDTMQNSSTEAFVATTLFKSLYMFLATFYVPGWFAANGAVTTYRALAILNLGFAALGMPMYVLGKRWRGLVSRVEILRRAAGQ
jgi:hypothetical protein